MYVYIFVNLTMFTFFNELNNHNLNMFSFVVDLQDINNFSSVFQILKDFQNFHNGKLVEIVICVDFYSTWFPSRHLSLYNG